MEGPGTSLQTRNWSLFAITSYRVSETKHVDKLIGYSYLIYCFAFMKFRTRLLELGVYVTFIVSINEIIYMVPRSKPLTYSASFHQRQQSALVC
jgi:hypothetical protein